MTVGGEDCVHVVGAVDAARDVHMAPEPFQVRLSLIDDDSGVVSHTVRNAFFSVSLLINPVCRRPLLLLLLFSNSPPLSLSV